METDGKLRTTHTSNLNLIYLIIFQIGLHVKSIQGYSRHIYFIFMIEYINSLTKF